MAHLWMMVPARESSEVSDERVWAHTEIAGPSELHARSIRSLGDASLPLPTGTVMLVPYQKSGRIECWALLAPPDSAVRINEWPLTTGIRALRDAGIHVQLGLGRRDAQRLYRKFFRSVP